MWSLRVLSLLIVAASLSGCAGLEHQMQQTLQEAQDLDARCKIIQAQAMARGTEKPFHLLATRFGEQMGLAGWNPNNPCPKGKDPSGAQQAICDLIRSHPDLTACPGSDPGTLRTQLATINRDLNNLDDRPWPKDLKNHCGSGYTTRDCAKTVLNIDLESREKLQDFLVAVQDAQNTLECMARALKPNQDTKQIQNNSYYNALALKSQWLQTQAAVQSLLVGDMNEVMEDLFVQRYSLAAAGHFFDLLQGPASRTDALLAKLDDKTYLVTAIMRAAAEPQIQSEANNITKTFFEHNVSNPVIQLEFARAACTRLQEMSSTKRAPSEVMSYILTSFTYPEAIQSIDGKQHESVKLLLDKKPDSQSTNKKGVPDWHFWLKRPKAPSRAELRNKVENIDQSAVRLGVVLKESDQYRVRTQSEFYARENAAARGLAIDDQVVRRVGERATGEAVAMYSAAETAEERKNSKSNVFKAKELPFVKIQALIPAITSNAIGQISHPKTMQYSGSPPPMDSPQKFGILNVSNSESTYPPAEPETPNPFCSALLHDNRYMRCYPTQGGTYRIEIDAPFANLRWKNDEVYGELRALAERVKAQSLHFTATIYGYASSARASAHVLKDPTNFSTWPYDHPYAAPQSPSWVTLRWNTDKREVDSTPSARKGGRSTAPPHNGNLLLSLARATWAGHVLDRWSGGAIRVNRLVPKSDSVAEPGNNAGDRIINIYLSPVPVPKAHTDLGAEIKPAR